MNTTITKLVFVKVYACWKDACRNKYKLKNSLHLQLSKAYKGHIIPDHVTGCSIKLYHANQLQTSSKQSEHQSLSVKQDTMIVCVKKTM